MKNFQVARLFDLMADQRAAGAGLDPKDRQARRGWLEKAGVVNTWPLQKLEAWTQRAGS